ncbi:MAG: FMN-binding negative transcriptional regulator [Firmicutes bacterium]|jgi:transcriptional regulator|nr:FMN-binding negative transcriptional regulator [Bacillota bacterium]MCL5065920.1 FMN-binding negative transcriptional regulator [Bacillota bacterium]
MKDSEELFGLVRQHRFGILFSAHDDDLKATHLPFVIDEHSGAHGALLSHMAKANPHWKDLDQRDVLVVFPGPHAFVSSLWYEAKGSVPTWNYTAVHVRGRAEVLSDREALKQLIRIMLKAYEPDSPIVRHLDDPEFASLLEAIVGFKIEIHEMEGKRKLNQNLPIEIQQKVITALRTLADSDSQKIADLMTENLEQTAKNFDSVGPSLPIEPRRE